MRVYLAAAGPRLQWRRRPSYWNLVEISPAAPPGEFPVTRIGKRLVVPRSRRCSVWPGRHPAEPTFEGTRP
jgi:hypothetical protein